MGFIRTILIIVVLYYLIKIVIRYIVPVLFGNYMNRKMNSFSDQYHHQQHTAGRRKEGEVTIDTSKAGSSPQKRNDRGEYIDYEEIKD
ncbi:MAG: DUF4834 family protein [Bacteroidales bacterium]|nr:DUF4834 family protein [Bacteroidales bacterium]MBN2764201.1 DUF4834 family protein [Bacteroidales bacterium]